LENNYNVLLSKKTAKKKKCMGITSRIVLLRQRLRPALSSDLNSRDFDLLGTQKDKVCMNKPHSLQ
jgi:hypothetical protein